MKVLPSGMFGQVSATVDDMLYVCLPPAFCPTRTQDRGQSAPRAAQQPAKPKPAPDAQMPRGMPAAHTAGAPPQPFAEAGRSWHLSMLYRPRTPTPCMYACVPVTTSMVLVCPGTTGGTESCKTAFSNMQDGMSIITTHAWADRWMVACEWMCACLELCAHPCDEKCRTHACMHTAAACSLPMPACLHVAGARPASAQHRTTAVVLDRCDHMRARICMHAAWRAAPPGAMHSMHSVHAATRSAQRAARSRQRRHRASEPLPRQAARMPGCQAGTTAARVTCSCAAACASSGGAVWHWSAAHALWMQGGDGKQPHRA